LQKDIDVNLAVRLGIHTGLVVAGEMGGGDVRESMAIVGETPNIAARLEGIAEPDTLAISPATYQLIEGYFECMSMGLHTLKGISQPMEVYKVLHKTGVQSRLDLSITKGLTPLVGREQEVQFLLDRWEQVKEGMGQVVLLSGEAGIGKSRLLQVLKGHLEGELHTTIENRCSPYYQNSSLYPVIDHFQRFLQFKGNDSSEIKVSKLKEFLEQYGLQKEEMVPLFAKLLSIPIPDSYTQLNLSPEKYKQKTFESLLTILVKEAEKYPVIRIVEDLHWVDPYTLEYLGLLVEQAPTSPIFTLFTFRPDFIPPWTMRSHISQITLSRLHGKQVEVMVDRVAGGNAIPKEIIKQIVNKTDGVPLFVEELTKMVIESELLNDLDACHERTGAPPTLAIPTTLKDSLMARLDRLDTGKDLAQVGATIGREFNYSLLQAVSPLDEENLQIELSKLVEAEFLYQRGLPPNSRYYFKHALIQEAAYESLLKSKRQKYHQKIAEALEQNFPDTVENQPELLAHHYTEAGLVEQAIRFWQKAGQRAIEQLAYVEAIGHLNKGLELLKTLPDATERTQQELELLIGLGAPLRVTKGFAAPDVERVYARAHELCKQIGDTTLIFPALRGMCGFYISRAETNNAHELAKQYLHLAQRARDTAQLLQAHYLMGATSLCLGEIEPSLEQTEKAYALYNPQEHSSHAFLYGQDPGAACLFWISWALWFLGYPDKALIKSHEAINLAKSLSHPYTLAIALDIEGFIYQFCGDDYQLKEKSKASIDLCNEGGFGFILPMGIILYGWSLTANNKTGEEGIKQILQGISSWRESRAELFCTYWFALLGEVYIKAGMKNEASKALSEGLRLANKNEERYYEAELHRLKGESIKDSSGSSNYKAEESFRKAIDISRKQKSKSLELRAVTSLCRLLQKQGKKIQAREMLEEIYSWYTEGFDTRDLKEAKALLKELS
ncbi:MAG: AAA family ATPase, partial [bacterium]